MAIGPLAGAWLLLAAAALGFGTTRLSGRHAHDLRAAGWLGIMAYWPLEAPSTLAQGDAIAGIAMLLAPALGNFLALHERRSARWGEDPAPLKWLAAFAAVATLCGVLTYQVAEIRYALMFALAWKTQFLLSMLGVDTTLMTSAAGSPLLAFDGRSVLLLDVAYECTAAVILAILAGAILASPDAPALRRRTLWQTLALGYVANLARVVFVAYATVQEWNPLSLGEGASEAARAFAWNHMLGSLWGFVAILAGALFALARLPGMLHVLTGTWRLPSRHRPGHFAPPLSGGNLE